MKRLLLRIALLTTIVALGLIAIAQAQRGYSTHRTTASTPATGGPVDEGAPPPIQTATNLTAEPGRLPTGIYENPYNPLRSGPAPATAAGAVRATSLTASGDSTGAQVPESIPLSPSGSPSVQRVDDPLGAPPPMLIAPGGNDATASNAASSGSVYASPQELPANSAPPAMLSSGPRPSSAMGGGNVGLAVPAEPAPSEIGASVPSSSRSTASRQNRLADARATAARSAAAPTIDPFGPEPALSTATSNNVPMQPPTTIPDNFPAASSPAPASLTANNSMPAASALNEPAPIGAAMEQAMPMGASAGGPGTGGPGTGSPGTGTPGQASLEGPQVPQLSIQKIAPAEIQVGRPAKFQVKVRNTGSTTAQNVQVRDEIPRGTQLEATTPRASQGQRGELIWSLGTLRPGEEGTVEMEVRPEVEGEIGSVASVSFNAEASAKTIATRPQLVVKTTAPRQVLLGEEVVLGITVSNPGTGVAENVIVEEHVPAGLQHAAGSELENELGTLKPGESRQLELRMTASQAGAISNIVTVRGANNLRSDDKAQIEVLAPQLEVAMEGPKRRYLEREAVYTVQISNPGTAPAHQVELIAQLPAGLKFVNANNAGSYDPNTQTVHWLLEELPVRETGSVQLTALPVSAGEQTIRVRGSAQRGLQTEKTHSVLIEGIAAIFFEVVDVADPIEVNGKTTYEIRVVNQGSKAATNVQVLAEFPAGMRPLAAEGARYTASGNTVAFEPLARLAPKADTTFRIQAQGVQPGDQRIRVQLKTDELQQPVTKEESTRVYSDG